MKDLSEGELRKRVANKMATHSWVPGVKELISLVETVNNVNSSTDKRFSNKRPVSPVIESESGEFIFSVGRRIYAMNESGEVRIARNDEITNEFASLIGLAESFEFSEEGLRMKLNNGIVDIVITENEDGTTSKELKLDGAKLDENHLSSALMATGKFRAGDYSTIKVLEHAMHSADKLFELDFVETIKSNVYEGVEVNVFKTENGIYVNKINSYMNENVLVKPETTTDAINLVMEFVDYDITNSVKDLLEGEAKIEEARKQEENDIYERIDYIKNEISKISELGMDEMEEIKEAKKILNDALEAEKAKLNAMFKTKNVEVHEASDADYVPGEIKMKVKTYKPGTKVQVNAGQYTEGGGKDMIDVILPSNEIVPVQKKYLGVEI
jgi:mannose/fructose/N-acetylgalactosamine-specific phosphotransferase system component IIB